MQKCTLHRPLEKLSQNEVAAIKADLLRRSFDVEFVDKVMSDTFMEMTENSTIEDYFVATVSGDDLLDAFL